MVFYNLIENGEIIEGPTLYSEVLVRTGLKDQVGLTELGWEEHFEPVPVVEITAEMVASSIRIHRNHLLLESDWTQGADSPLSDETKIEWATYRQSLRDMPANNADVTDARDAVLPTMPT